MAYPANTFQLSIIGETGTEPVENVLSYHASSSSGDKLQDAGHLTEAWVAALEVLWLGCCPADYIIYGYRCRYVGPSGGPTYQVIRASKPNGLRPGNSITTGSGPILTFPVFNSGLAHRPNSTGKIFVPGVGVADVTQDVFNPDLITSCNTFIAQLLMTLSSGGVDFNFCIASRESPIVIPATVGNCSLLVGTQRRRMRPTL